MQLCLHVSRLAIWKLLDDMGQLMLELVVIYSNNISSIMFVNNPIYHTRANHIDGFVREKVLAKRSCICQHGGVGG